MKLAKLVLTLLLCGASVLWSNCSAKSDSSATSRQTATVTRGNLVVSITGSGNLALSHKESLAFDMAGTVDQVAVKEGDYIKKGDTLANLNTTDDWEAQITSLQRSLTASQRQVTAAQRNETAAEEKVTAAQQALADAQTQAVTQVASANMSLLQAQMDGKNAEIALAKAQGTYTSPQIVVAKAQMRLAEIDINYDSDCASATTGKEQSNWVKQMQSDISKLDGLRAKLNSLLPIGDDDRIATLTTQLQMARSDLNSAQDAVPQAEASGNRSIVNAQYALDDAKLVVEDAKAAIEDAQTAVDDAQAALDKAKRSNPLVQAPFDGFVTLVNVSGGNEVKKGTIALQIAEPTKFEAQISVSETDYPKVKLGQNATIQLTAVPSVTLSANVTYISPTSSSSGTYAVKVSLSSVAYSTSGQGQISSYQLTEGTSVLVNIVVESRQNVLLVPNEAIGTQGRQSVVTVLADNQTQTRQVQTGIVDWQYTEVTSGLSEGETVVYTPSTVRPTTSTTKSASQGQGQMQQPPMPAQGGGPTR